MLININLKLAIRINILYPFSFAVLKMFLCTLKDGQLKRDVIYIYTKLNEIILLKFSLLGAV